jgi:hypothetical protein
LFTIHQKAKTMLVQMVEMKEKQHEQEEMKMISIGKQFNSTSHTSLCGLKHLVFNYSNQLTFFSFS